jgi:bacteriocin biosynthesis cyclodehydratase domain-containing protein
MSHGFGGTVTGPAGPHHHQGADVGQPIDLEAEPPLGLQPWLATVELGDRIGLYHGERLVELAGPRSLTTDLLRLLDGSRTETQILDELPDAQRAAAGRALGALREAGVLRAGHLLPTSDERTALAHALAAAQPRPTDPAALADRLAAASVAVVGDGRSAVLAATLLSPAGLATTTNEDAVGRVDLVVAAPGPSARVELHELGRRCHDAGQPWLPVVPFDGAVALVGPLVLPGRSACFECTLLRRAAAVEYTDDAASLFDDAPPPPTPWFVDALAAATAVAVALQWIGCLDPRLPGEVRIVDAGQLAVSAERVLRVPRCPLCSPTARLGAAYPWSPP